jgi:hypothetical protein
MSSWTFSGALGRIHPSRRWAAGLRNMPVATWQPRCWRQADAHASGGPRVRAAALPPSGGRRMPETAKLREPESPAPDQGAGKAPSAALRERKRDEPVVWPRDMNAPTTKDLVWGLRPGRWAWSTGVDQVQRPRSEARRRPFCRTESQRGHRAISGARHVCYERAEPPESAGTLRRFHVVSAPGAAPGELTTSTARGAPGFRAAAVLQGRESMQSRFICN